MLFVCGDSLVAGYPIREQYGKEKTWPYLLNQEFIDKSRSASSNDRIFRKSVLYLDENISQAIIIWTHYTRLEFSEQGKYIQNLSSDKNSKYWFKNCQNTLHDLYRTLNYIISIQAICETQNINLLQGFSFNNLQEYMDISSFNQMLEDNQIFDFLTDDMIKRKYEVYSLLHNKVNWNNFLDKTLKEISIDFEKNHPGLKSQQVIANYILEKING